MFSCWSTESICSVSLGSLKLGGDFLSTYAFIEEVIDRLTFNENSCPALFFFNLQFLLICEWGTNTNKHRHTAGLCINNTRCHVTINKSLITAK